MQVYSSMSHINTNAISIFYRVSDGCNSIHYKTALYILFLAIHDANWFVVVLLKRMSTFILQPFVVCLNIWCCICSRNMYVYILCQGGKTRGETCVKRDTKVPISRLTFLVSHSELRDLSLWDTRLIISRARRCYFFLSCASEQLGIN